MSAYNLAKDKSTVLQSNVSTEKAIQQTGKRKCPNCGKEYSGDARALPAFVEHVSGCDLDPGQSTLGAFGGDAE